MPGFVLPTHRPALMGVLNVTPDSFSDGGQFLDPQPAIRHGLRMMAEGADLVDVGGESTRPGAEPVPEAVEIDRVLPVVRALVAQGVPVSIDTMKPAVAHAALQAGAVVLNDVTALTDPDMVAVAREAEVSVCLMHLKGTPQTMQANPHYDDVVKEVALFLVNRARAVEAAGVDPSLIWIDPGIGFGKTTAHNLTLLADLPRLVALGYPVLVGASRKSFLGRLLGSEADPLPVREREEATLAIHTLAQAAGTRILRTHDPLAGSRALRAAAAVLDRVSPRT